jgi:Family of unknown function (DUF5317)
VWVLIIGVVLALLVVLATRGSYGQLVVTAHSWWMLLVAAALLIGVAIADLPDDRLDTLGFGIVMLAYVFIFAFCILNMRLTGMVVVTIGVAMNALVFGLNRGMPVDTDGASGETTVFHRPEEDRDLLPFLGEIIPLPEPFEQMVTFGDLVIGVGLVDVAYHASRRPARRRRPTTALVRERAATS